MLLPLWAMAQNDLYKRFTAQLNATYNIKPWLEVGTNNSLSYIDANTISEGSAQYGQMAAINKMDPLTPVVYSQVPSYVQDAINACKVVLYRVGGIEFAKVFCKLEH